MNKKKGINNSIETYDTYIIDLVHNYFYFFYSWTPYNPIQKFIISSLQVTVYLSIILFVFMYFYNLSNIYFNLNMDYFIYIFIIFMINLFLQILSLTMGYFILSPTNNIKIVQKRILEEFYYNTELNKRGKTNYYISKFELEKIWFEKVLGNNTNIEYLIEKIAINLKRRKPTSRSIETIINSAIQNPYIINSLVVVFTVSLTIGLSPLITSISDDNFTSVFKILNITAFNTWILLVFIFIIIKFIFMIFEWSFEYSINKKQFIAWRYEIFLDMLARHQQVKTHKPKIRLPAQLSS